MASGNKRGYLCTQITRPHLRSSTASRDLIIFLHPFFFPSFVVSDMHRDAESWRGNSAEVEIVVVFFIFSSPPFTL